MMRRDTESGYALLAVLVVMVLAATFALAVAGAVHSLQLVEAADADAGRASRLEATATGQVLRHLRWAPIQASGSSSGADAALQEQWTCGASGAAFEEADTAAKAHVAGAATVEMRVEDWAVGVSCEHDADVAARLTVSGSGLYVGGCLRGREEVSFGVGGAGLTADGRPVDGARGADCPVAAAHAGAGIFAGGAEVHDPPVAVYADDGDQHAGTPPLPAWVTGPSAEFLAAAQSEATPVGDALYDGSLHLDAIRAADPSEMVAGRCIVVTGLDEVTIEGMAAEDAGPLLVIVTGDAVIGQPGVPVLLRGGLVVCGRMRVRSEFRLDGTLHAGSLEVDAATAVTVPADWRDRPLPGAARPVVVEVAT